MYISSIQVSNYKNYRESSTLTLRTGINIITGRNNVGKTALLEALSLSFHGKPHRSVLTLPKVDTPSVPGSTVRATLQVSSQELKESIFIPNQQIDILVPKPAHADLIKPPSAYHHQNDALQAQSITSQLLSEDVSRLTVQLRATPASAPIPVPGASSTGIKIEPQLSGLYCLARCLARADGQIEYKQSVNVANNNGTDFGYSVANLFRQRVYLFRAERYNLGTCAVGPERILKPDASNLAEVLSNLNSNPKRFQRFNDTVNHILSQVQQVTVKNLPNNQLEIFVWNDDPSREREDLAVSLNESGTGVGQVLAIVYVVLYSDHPRTILIDEPQSFLHPGAVRKLIEVLKQHPEHQYILTTHSPTVISAAEPSTITLIKQNGAESDFHVIDPKKNEEIRQYLIEIGARLADAFGADGVLWVEGPTEQICFPLILTKLAKRSLMGTAIIAVKHTGDLEGRHAKSIFEVYDRLTEGNGLLPPAVGFIFDKEGRPERERRDIQDKSKNLVSFTPRRLYENYLLNPEAIAGVANSIEGFRDPPLTPGEVQKWIDAEVDAWFRGERADRKYGSPPAEGRSAWLEAIHGAKLLEQLFSSLSETRVAYQKTRDSVALTKWLLDNSPEDLRELADLITATLDKAERKLHPGRSMILDGA